MTAVEGDAVSAEDLVANALPYGRTRAGGARRRRDVRGDEGARLADACVILDPPRTGLSPVVSAALAAVLPRRVIYVSCDPATLARDLQVLTAAGLRIDALTVFDLFPLTAHVETVVTLINEV